MAADADCSKVHILEAVRRADDEGQRSFSLQLDLPELEKKIGELGDVLLVIIDPITSYLGNVDSHKNAELRSVLEPLGKMAARQRATVIANTHLSKASGGSANSRVIGSVAFVNHARAAFIVTADSEDSGKRLFLPSKTNLGKPRDGLAYRIADTVLPDPEGSVIWVPYVKWEDAPVTMTADEAMAAMAGGVEGKSAVEEAKQFLTEVLTDGGMAANEVKKAAEGAGLTWATVRRAKSLIGIKPHKAGMHAGWLWALPKVLKSSEGAQASGMSTFVNNEHLRGLNTSGYAGGGDFEERAAILEYDGGLSRVEAEAQAAAEMPDLPVFLRRVQ
jgi:putative DNA primase/helicase